MLAPSSQLDSTIVAFSSENCIMEENKKKKVSVIREVANSPISKMVKLFKEKTGIRTDAGAYRYALIRLAENYEEE